jgi:hypothetical protein
LLGASLDGQMLLESMALEMMAGGLLR